MPWLLESEAEHNLLLGLVPRLMELENRFEPPIYLATIEMDEHIVGCAFRTPPYKLGLTRMPEAAVALLVQDLEHVYSTLPAVLGPDPVTGIFAELWGERKGVSSAVGMRQRIYQLERVRMPSRKAPGSLRAAHLGDLDLLEGWIHAFTADAGAEAHNVRRTAEARINEGAAWLWVDGAPHSMAAEAGHTPNGTRIGYVYTPPEFRGRGYASSCVAALSQRVLETGRKVCFLYTDLSNPTSNNIYQRLGYEPVSDVVDYVFSLPHDQRRPQRRGPADPGGSLDSGHDRDRGP